MRVRSASRYATGARPYCAKNIKNLFFDPAKSTEVSPEGNFKDSITRKRWLGTHPDFPAVLPLLPRVVGLPVGPGGEGQQLGATLIGGGPAVVALLGRVKQNITFLRFHISTFPHFHISTFPHFHILIHFYIFTSVQVLCNLPLVDVREGGFGVGNFTRDKKN